MLKPASNVNNVVPRTCTVLPLQLPSHLEDVVLRQQVKVTPTQDQADGRETAEIAAVVQNIHLLIW